MAKTWPANLFSTWDALLVLAVLVHVVLAPFTKVEESFNVQATHDLLYHRGNLTEYDHQEFPGVVPRTFLGAISLAATSFPLVAWLQTINLPKVGALYVVRIVLGLATASSLIALNRQIRSRFGPNVGRAFALVCCSQFHLLFYASRPLPNIFALGLVSYAYARWLEGRPVAMLRFVVFAMGVFRCDLVILLGPLGLHLLLTRSISFWAAFRCCFVAAVASLAVTVAVDSFFWGRWLWPEGEVLWFNTVLNKSADWGVSPWHWYFTSALPRALLGAYPLALLGAFLDRRAGSLLWPILLFVSLYSYLPHKELRFIFPAFPIFNTSAAVAIERIRINWHKSWLWKLLGLSCAGLLLGSLAATCVFTAASAANYPGGEALRLLHKLESSKPHLDAPPYVHVDVLPAMTGVSRFLEEPGWRYSKEEGLDPEDYASRNFTHLLSGRSDVPHFKLLAAVEGFHRVRLRRALWPVYLEKIPSTFIHVRSDAGP
ncbi:alpha-1,6-mannosyltransferase [Klebsormidium nitens]|uniref:Mannosyltransferase n=1 Tax=Klebsormidium nitens TaxID=105231 RepID=A0A1Y1HPD7_KLENI|nr:alpha-1,6-mannosyltransferase [Klebsormidium nitens]|eukprot:GAQ78841.1 alpha-1,6-mannosyltransferase [Klebsormidium nitens]